MPRTGMKIAFLINNIADEVPTAATTVLTRAAVTCGHEVFVIGIGDLTYDSRGHIRATARVPAGAGDSQEEFFEALQSRDAKQVSVTTDELDVLYLRYNPGQDESRPWEYQAGMIFGQVAVLHGVIVLSHPYTLPYAVSKMYLEHFPESIRPRTLVTRSYEEIVKFHKDEKGKIVVKPLHGFGGKDVYRIDEDAANLKQIVESIARGGYIIAQEYLPAASEGDTRLFLFNGKPLVVDGKYAAVRRINAEDDFRSNMSAGGKPHRAQITPEILEIADIIGPRLLADGIFDAGIDIVGDKLVEINAISSGGLNAAGKLEGVDFGPAVIRLIERKVEHRRRYGRSLRNRSLAVLD